ncbi:alpha/beta hydrolase [Nocardioidaceae bacterium SCSIO 66511]|nr:alpha/beta hydrolase [Nocardioidaceae bacterium SCSIO 66511]
MRTSTIGRLAVVALPLVGLLAPVVATNSVHAVEPTTQQSLTDAAVPDIDWQTCDLIYQCAKVEVPLDHDDPSGETTKLPIKRLPASNPAERVGALFMNFGGPGATAADNIQFTGASLMFGNDVRAKFDIVGLDPRGTSEQTLTCAPAPDTEAPPAPTTMAPETPEEIAAKIAYDDYVRDSCDKTAPPIIDHMSTADVARDMDLVRQALGDEKLSYYGLSYGSVLGETYASMFPDRVGAMVIDGVIDPVTYANDDGSGEPYTSRWGMAPGIEEALSSAFARCDKVGILRCPLAGNAWKRWHRVVDSLDKQPLALPGLTIDGEYFKYGLTVNALQMHRIGGVPLPTIELLAGATKIIDVLRFGLSQPAARSSDSTLRLPGVGRVDLGAQNSVLLDRLGEIVRKIMDQAEKYGFPPLSSSGVAADQGPDEPVLSGAQFGVSCSDTENPTDPNAWVTAAENSKADAPNFGPGVVWSSSVCANWPGSSESAYRGPFDTDTSMLMIGNTHDNATPMAGAKLAHQRFPGSSLITLNSWGHTAIGKSFNCIQPKVDSYLLTEKLPADGTVCQPDAQLFG